MRPYPARHSRVGKYEDKQVTVDQTETVLQVKLIDNIISLSAYSEKNGKSWQTKIQSMSEFSEVLTHFISNIEELHEYLQDRSNVRIDYQAGQLIILLKTTLKNKQVISELTTIQMRQSKALPTKNKDLYKILAQCGKQEPLMDGALKNIIKIITQTILNQPQIQVEEVNPLFIKIQSIGQEIQKLQYKFNSLSQEVQQTRRIIDEETRKLNIEIKQNASGLKDYIETVKQGVDREMMKVSNKHQEMIYNVRYDDMQAIGQLRANIKDQQRNLQNIMQSIGGDLKLNLKEPPLLSIIDAHQPHFKNFKFIKNIVTRASKNDGNFVMAVGKISVHRKPKFLIKLQKLQYPMYFGVIHTKHRNQQYCEKNDIRAWCSSEGILFDGVNERKQAGMGFKQGQQVLMDVLAELGVIRWKIGEDEAVVSCPKFLSEEMLPCIWVGGEGDSFTVITQH